MKKLMYVGKIVMWCVSFLALWDNLGEDDTKMA